jgi:hypothetical protein
MPVTYKALCVHASALSRCLYVPTRVYMDVCVYVPPLRRRRPRSSGCWRGWGPMRRGRGSSRSWHSRTSTRTCVGRLTGVACCLSFVFCVCVCACALSLDEQSRRVVFQSIDSLLSPCPCATTTGATQGLPRPGRPDCGGGWAGGSMPCASTLFKPLAHHRHPRHRRHT